MATEFYIRIPGVVPPHIARMMRQDITHAARKYCPDALVRQLPAPILRVRINENINEISIVRTTDNNIIESFNVQDITDPKQSRYSLMAQIYQLAKRIRVAYEMPQQTVKRHERETLIYKQLNKEIKQ